MRFSGTTAIQNKFQRSHKAIHKILNCDLHYRAVSPFSFTAHVTVRHVTVNNWGYRDSWFPTSLRLGLQGKKVTDIQTGNGSDSYTVPGTVEVK